MSVLAFPHQDEVEEIVNSVAAKHSAFNLQPMFFSTMAGGMRFRLALLQHDADAETKTVRFVAAQTDVDLRSCFEPIIRRRK